MSEQKRLGLFGGSFDPVHCGHIRLAQAACKELRLDSVYFIPAWKPPHKRHKTLSSAAARVRMLSLALAPYPGMRISRFELARRRVTYSYQTVAHFRKKFPRAALYFIIGSDSLNELHTWKRIDLLLSRCRLVVGRRKGSDLASATARYPAHILARPLPAISSSAIRQRAQSGRSLRGLVPQVVEHYLRNNKNLSYHSMKTLTPEDILPYLKARVSPARYQHTLGTWRTAEDLARRHGISLYKVMLTALLHDAGKGMPAAAMVRFVEKHRIPVPRKAEIIRHNPSLLHSYISAYIARTRFKITDQDVLEAIRLHTVGGAAMSTLAKILYLADATAPNRRRPGVKQMRWMAKRDLDRALQMAVGEKLFYVLMKKKWLDPAAAEAWNYLIAAESSRNNQ